jgi:hypothetical protein
MSWLMPPEKRLLGLEGILNIEESDEQMGAGENECLKSADPFRATGHSGP